MSRITSVYTLVGEKYCLLDIAAYQTTVITCLTTKYNTIRRIVKETREKKNVGTCINVFHKENFEGIKGAIRSPKSKDTIQWQKEKGQKHK